MVFCTSARSTAVVSVLLVFWVYQCASCVFADQTGRDEEVQSHINKQFLQSLHIGESMTSIIMYWCLMHSHTDRSSKKSDN